MAKRTLNNTRRTIIMNYLGATINKNSFPDLLSKITELGAEVEQIAIEAATAKYPQNDMKVLKRYEAAYDTSKIPFSGIGEFGGRESFVFDLTGTLVLPENIRWNNIKLPDDHPLVPKLWELKKLQIERKDKINLLMKDYFELVRQTKYFDDLLAVVPEVREIEDKLYITNPIAVFNAELVARVKDDVKAREENHKKAA